MQNYGIKYFGNKKYITYIIWAIEENKMSLNYYLDGSTETINTHVSVDPSWEDSMVLRENGSTKYISLDSDLTNLDQSKMRVRKNGTTYSVLFNGSVTPTTGSILLAGEMVYIHEGLGEDGDQHTSSPVQFSGTTDWVATDASLGTLISIKNDGTLWTCGRNQVGELGVGNRIHRSSPVQVGSLTTWTKVSGASATLGALRNDGTLWLWGYNHEGQLGDNTIIHRSSPVQVIGTAGWSSFCVTESINVYGIKTDGSIWAWGSNSAGQLGINLPATSLFCISSPVQIGSLTGWTSVCGGYCNAIAMRGGALYSWGYNSSGELGLGDQIHRSSPVQIGSDTNWTNFSLYYRHTLATKSNGTLWTWGYNDYGELGLGDRVNRSSPVQIGSDTDWSKVITGSFFSAAIKTDGTLWTWGYNQYGQLANNTSEMLSSPVQVGHISNWNSLSSTRYMLIGLF
jgi:alpha-tubulin suppressor-like RCC1 family protein